MHDTDNSDDFDLFRQSVKGVKRISHDRADVGKAASDLATLKVRQASATQRSQQTRVDGLSDLFIIDVGAEDELYWARDGVQDSQLKRLKSGQIPFEGSIDLHGMSVEKARETLWDFFAEASKLEVRCVRVTHGKAARMDGRKPMLKSHVNTWLRQHPLVLGFVSCQPKHGGTGALYVLLKRHMMEGRDD
ncbi:Smr/MutS family protein [Atopomonas sediminilitoris]|uniref:Smr/MutS family protein n=1 Tax=Atopomonas sediminilitoris TaxID=2919919 RepID=UPI001F4E9C98|nr:Smr/MutS family protein [Atopomonas sediminilitoris]MCJ8168950.1 Smr/MutS family protein [Atopomonas sediminilitoris]